jgi:hypothetical protein
MRASKLSEKQSKTDQASTIATSKVTEVTTPKVIEVAKPSTTVITQVAPTKSDKESRRTNLITTTDQAVKTQLEQKVEYAPQKEINAQDVFPEDAMLLDDLRPKKSTTKKANPH